MKQEESIDNKLLSWVELHRIPIGIALVLAILTGTIALAILNRKPVVVEKTSSDPMMEDQIAQLRQQNDLLRQQLEQSQKSAVAGASTSKTLTASTVKSSSTTSKSTPVSGSININTADQKALESLPKIGPTIASRIIDYRNQNGPYKTIEDIKKVKGIGDKTFEAIKDKITVD